MKNYSVSKFFNLFIRLLQSDQNSTYNSQLNSDLLVSDLCGTPGYLAPEVLKCNMFENAEGYEFEVDMSVSFHFSLQ